MKKENIFEYATRKKLRFPYKGSISVEYLWDLPVTALDEIFKTLNAQKKQSAEESLLDTKSESEVELGIQISIVKHIVSVKLQEKEDRENAIKNKEQSERIMSILEARKNKALEDATDEELQAMLEELK